jgi:hypothetical protein
MEPDEAPHVVGEIGEVDLKPRAARRPASRLPQTKNEGKLARHLEAANHARFFEASAGLSVDEWGVRPLAGDPKVHDCMTGRGFVCSDCNRRRGTIGYWPAARLLREIRASIDDSAL